MRYRIGAGIPAVLLACAVLGGCGAELLAGGQREGEVSALATDGSGGPSAARAGGGGYSASLARTAAAIPEGSLELTAAVTLIGEDGEEAPVTDGAVAARLRLAAADTVPLGTEEVPEGEYTRARVVFSRVQAEVTGGLSIGGVPILGAVAVEIGSAPLVVEAPVQVLVREDDPALLVVDLNVAAWIAAADPLTRRVPAAALRSAVEISAR